jgi:two-component system sensor histidine kinase CpxA
MKITRLYLKIFFAFVAVLVAAEAVVFGFVLSMKMHPPFFRDSLERVMVIDMLVERELADAPTTPKAVNSRIKPLLDVLAAGLHGDIWLTDDRGAPVSASFDGPPPDIEDDLKSVNLKAPEGVRFFLVENRKYRSVYLDSEIALHDGTAMTVHVLYGKHPPREEEWFLKGLILLTCLGALFIIPVSRRITRPILKLAETAERLGQGDFSRRVEEKGHDEVAVLARKFNRMAGRLEKMVLSGKELTAQLSHELRSPLARMRISLQMILERTESGQGADNTTLLTGMRDEIEHMDALIGRMLDLSKLDLREPPPRTDSVDVAGLLRELLGHYGPMIDRRSIRIEADLSETPRLLCQGINLRCLMDNVLGNAIKYAGDQGMVALLLRLEGKNLEVRVSNSHAPLSEDELTAMFIPFHRLGRGSETGSGLGLATAQRIVTMHDGSIEASNGHFPDGEDCLTITITLPLA